MRTQGSCNTVQTKGSCNFNRVVQYSTDSRVMQLKSDEHRQRLYIYVNCSDLVYHVWCRSGLRGSLVFPGFYSNSLMHSGSNLGLANIYNFLSCQFRKMYKCAKFDQNIWCGSSVMSIFTTGSEFSLKDLDQPK